MKEWIRATRRNHATVAKRVGFGVYPVIIVVFALAACSSLNTGSGTGASSSGTGAKGNQVQVIHEEGNRSRAVLPGSWEVVGGVIKSPTYISDISLRLDSSGNPYVVYKNDSGVLAMKYSGGSWQEADAQALSGGYVGSVADSKGVLYRWVFALSPQEPVSVESYSSGKWQRMGTEIVGVDTSNDAARLAIDSSDTLYIAYEQKKSITVKKWVDGSWQMVGPAGFAYDLNGFAFDSSDTPYVGASNKVWKYSAGAWQAMGDSVPHVPLVTEMVVDPSGTCYVLGEEGNPRYSYGIVSAWKFESGSWQKLGSEPINEETIIEYQIVVDSAGTVYVAYPRNENGRTGMAYESRQLVVKKFVSDQ